MAANKHIINSALATFMALDAEGLRKAMAPDVQVWLAGLGTVTLTQFLALIEHLNTDGANCEINQHNAIGDADRVAISFELSLHIPGASSHHNECHVHFRLASEQIVAMRCYFDTAHLGYAFPGMFEKPAVAKRIDTPSHWDGISDFVGPDMHDACAPVQQIVFSLSDQNDIDKSQQDSKAVVLSFKKSCLSGDLEQARSLAHPDARIWFAGMGSVTRDQFLATVVGQYQKFDLFTLTAEGPHVAAETASYRLQVERDNSPYGNSYHALYTVRDGKISEIWEYMDTAYVNGLFPGRIPQREAALSPQNSGTWKGMTEIVKLRS